MKTALYIITFFLGCSLADCGGRADSSDKSKAGTNILVKEQPVPVRIMVMKQGTFNRELLANGKLEARQRANLKFLTEGIIENIFIQEGDRVQSGQRLAVLDNAQQKYKYDQNKLRYQKAVYDYEDQLFRLGFNPADSGKMEGHAKSIARLRSGLDEADIELKRSAVELRHTVLNAPFLGKVANLKAQKYSAGASFEYFCTLIDDRELWVNFLVLEQELDFIRAAKTAAIIPFNNDSLVYTGIIASINPLVDRSGMVGVKVVIRNHKGQLLDGMNVKVIVQQPSDGQLTLPKNAVLDRQGRKVVFTVNGPVAIWNYVEIAFENSRELAIKSGLKAGDTVIYDGNYNLAHEKPITFISK